MKLRQLFLLPLAIIYGCITHIRNKLFDWHLLPSIFYKIPVISVGNLSTGGTGKTPHVAYIVNKLKNDHFIAILSRGYKRKTQGFNLAREHSTYEDIGDEPLQYKRNFKDILVAVDESRRSGIEILSSHYTDLEVIILDDAFQHRYVKTGLSILTTDFHNLYANDYMLPSGSLREFRKGARRADIVIVTKTPKVLSPITERRINDLLKIKEHQQLFFTYINYGNLIPLYEAADETILNDCKNILMLSGIANSYPFKEYLTSIYKNVFTIKFPDHHAYKERDMQKIRKGFDQVLSKQKIIITTEKDAMRLKTPDLQPLIQDLPIYYIPIEIKFHNEDNIIFDARIKDYVKEHPRSH